MVAHITEVNDSTFVLEKQANTSIDVTNPYASYSSVTVNLQRRIGRINA